MHYIEPKLKAVPEGDFILSIADKPTLFEIGKTIEFAEKQFIATANVDEVSVKTIYGKDISRNVAGSQNL